MSRFRACRRLEGGSYAYVGSRTDGQPQHRTPGILVVDVSDAESPQAEMLIVLTFRYGIVRCNRRGTTGNELWRPHAMFA